MKELSIEEKAKAYDEAIDKIKYVMEHGVSPTLNKEDLQDIFPELKESEDDRIRKELLEHCKNQAKPYIQTGNKCPQIQSWIAWLEKQGEQKPIIEMKSAEESLGIDSETYNKIVDECIYGDNKSTWGKQGGQKPADEVKPKFKIGVWVVSPTGVCWHIDRIENNRYEVTSDTGKCTDWPLDTDLYHLWTIQDAKDGDVLAYSDGSITLFKCMTGNLYMAHVLWVDGHIELNNSCAIFNVHPATKEQRDLLFSKMKEAGYEWDAEKKELKKIEQIQVIDYPDNLPKDNWELVHKFVNKFGRIPKDEDELNALVEYVLKRQKPAWSEEDERLRKEIVNYLECQKEEEPTRKDKINSWISWILKHSFSEWTKEEKEAWNKRLDCIIDILDWAEEKGRISLSDCQDYSIMLKSLRPQNRWKPSEEQMDALAEALSLAKNCGEECAFDLRTLYEQLKTL